jgi:hypothetical protein
MTSAAIDEMPITRRHPESECSGERFGDSNWWTAACAAVAVILTAITIWPIVDAGRAALDLNWIPSGDWAVLTLRVEDVGQNTPLVGPYSRFGWNHPGPLLYWLLAIPYRLLGGTPAALLGSAASLNTLVVIAISAVAWRRGRLPLVACSMATLAITFHAMGPALLRDPWNPFLTLLPLALTAFLAWSVLEGDTTMWPVFVLVASFMLQSHVGYLPMLGMIVLSVIAVAWKWTGFDALLPRSPMHRRWVVGTSLIVLILCWLPVLIDQLFSTGNIGAIVTYFVDPGDQPAGFGTALATASDQLRLPAAPWLGRSELTGTDGALLGASFLWLGLPLAAMVGAGWLAVHRRAFGAVRFQLVVTAASLGGVIATARVIGPLFDWVVRWWWVLAALWWLSILWSLWSSFDSWITQHSARRVATSSLAILSSIVILQAVTPIVDDVSVTQAPSPSTGRVIAEFLEPTLASLRGSGPLLVVTTGSVRGDYGDALRLQLERSGIDVVAEPNMETHLGPERSESRRTPTGTLWIVSADSIAVFRSDPAMVELGGWDPLTPAERAAFNAQKILLQDQLIAAGRVDLAEALTNGGGGVDIEAVGINGVDQQLLRQVEAIRRKGDPVAVFLGPARNR